MESADQSVIVTLCEWDQIYGLGRKDSIFGHVLPVTFEYWKAYNLFPSLVEKTKAGFRQINAVAFTNLPE